MKKLFFLLVFAICIFALTSCGNGDDDDNADDDAGSGNIALSQVNDWAYWLSDIDLGALGKSKFDLAVIDYSADGSEDYEWTSSQITSLKHSSGGAKIALAYMSIGEAEDYRFYWREDWLSNPPDWLGPENPDWGGNYKVRYWMQGWQDIILGADGYLERILNMGFDGVYLDIIDAYEYWGPDGNNENPNAANDMIDFVSKIASKGRAAINGFLVFPQNGAELADYEGYIGLVDGIGAEDTFYMDDELAAPDDTNYVTALLDLFIAQNKPVLSIDYCRESAHIDDFYAKAKAKGYIPYSSVRDLDQLIVNPGHEPD